MADKNIQIKLGKIAAIILSVAFIVCGALFSQNRSTARSTATMAIEQTQVYDAGAVDGSSPALYSSKSSSNSLTAGAASGTDSVESKIVKTVSVSIGVTDFDGACETISNAVEACGGTVSSSSMSTGNGSRMYYVLKIPSDRLDEFLTSASGNGRVISQDTYIEDETDSYYDIAARLENKRMLMGRLQEMAKSATNVSDLLEIEKEMSEVQSSIESMEASLARTDNRVMYATVNISVREEKPSDTMGDKDKSLSSRLLDGLKAGMSGFVEFCKTAAVFIASALPFIIIVAVVWIVVSIIRKIRKKSR